MPSTSTIETRVFNAVMAWNDNEFKFIGVKSEEIDEDATSVLIEADYVKLSRKVKVLYNVIVVHTDEKL